MRAACAGTVNVCIAYTEAGAGSDLSNIETAAAAPDDGGFVLDGEKVFVTGAHKADWCCTIARTDPASSGKRGLSMFLVDMTTPGVEVERVRDREPMDAVDDPLRRRARRRRRRAR